MEETWLVKVSHQYPKEWMWQKVRQRARDTVGKPPINSLVSETFKRDILLSRHTPIRELRFDIEFVGIPTSVAQAFSRHRVASVSGDFWLSDSGNPSDSEHYVRTQRPDRTGEPRKGADAPVNYSLTVTAAGLMDMSERRMCHGASKAATLIWNRVVEEIYILEPILWSMLVPSCVRYGFCIENQCECVFLKTAKAREMREKFISNSVKPPM